MTKEFVPPSLLVNGNLNHHQEIVSIGGNTVWGNPAHVGKVVGEAKFDAVLDNNGKDLDAVKFVVETLTRF